MSPKVTQNVDVGLPDGTRVLLTPQIYGWAMEVGAMMSVMEERERLAADVVMRTTEVALLVKRKAEEEAKKKATEDTVGAIQRVAFDPAPRGRDVMTLAARITPCSECGSGNAHYHREGCRYLTEQEPGYPPVRGVDHRVVTKVHTACGLCPGVDGAHEPQCPVSAALRNI